MHVKNGANQNMSNHKLTGAKYQLIRRFWCGMTRAVNGFEDIIPEFLWATEYMHGKKDVIHGAHIKILINMLQNGNMQNWKRRVNNDE